MRWGLGPSANGSQPLSDPSLPCRGGLAHGSSFLWPGALLLLPPPQGALLLPAQLLPSPGGAWSCAAQLSQCAQSNGKAAAGASNGKSNGRAPSSNGKPLGPANTTTEAADQAQDSKEDTNGKPASASREVASMTDMVRQEEQVSPRPRQPPQAQQAWLPLTRVWRAQSEYMAGQGAQAGADPDNAPHPASSWLPYSPPAEPRPVSWPYASTLPMLPASAAPAGCKADGISPCSRQIRAAGSA